MTQTQKSMILGANWRLANAKSSILKENNPVCMCEGERTERKSSVIHMLLRLEMKAHPSRITQAAAHHTTSSCCLCEWLYIFEGRAEDFAFFVYCEVTAAWRHDGSGQLWLFVLRCCALISTYLLFYAGLIALCCAYATVDARRHARTYKKRPTKKTGKKDPTKIERESKTSGKYRTLSKKTNKKSVKFEKMEMKSGKKRKLTKKEATTWIKSGSSFFC